MRRDAIPALPVVVELPAVQLVLGLDLPPRRRRRRRRQATWLPPVGKAA